MADVQPLTALHYNLTAVPPGKRAFPFHNHRVNEEMFFILEGTGEVRIGCDDTAVMHRQTVVIEHRQVDPAEVRLEAGTPDDVRHVHAAAVFERWDAVVHGDCPRQAVHAGSVEIRWLDAGKWMSTRLEGRSNPPASSGVNGQHA